MVIVWILIAVVLLAVELHHMAFFAIFGTAGAAAAALVSVVAPSALPLQCAVAVVVAAAGILLARPYVSRAFAHRRSGVQIGGVHGGLISARGITLDHVGTDVAGHVRLLGENWLARTRSNEIIPPSTPVVVVAVTGTTLTVEPAPEKGNPA